MPTSDPHQFRVAELLTAIDRSLLLTDERKSMLRSAIVAWSETDLARLEVILSEEDQVLDSVIHAAIERAVRDNDQAFLQKLGNFLMQSMKRLRKVDEGFEQEESMQHMNSLFD